MIVKNVQLCPFFPPFTFLCEGKWYEVVSEIVENILIVKMLCLLYVYIFCVWGEGGGREKDRREDYLLLYTVFQSFENERRSFIDICSRGCSAYTRGFAQTWPSRLFWYGQMNYKKKELIWPDTNNADKRTKSNMKRTNKRINYILVKNAFDS